MDGEPGPSEGPGSWPFWRRLLADRLAGFEGAHLGHRVRPHLGIAGAGDAPVALGRALAVQAPVIGAGPKSPFIRRLAGSGAGSSRWCSTVDIRSRRRPRGSRERGNRGRRSDGNVLHLGFLSTLGC